jgi:hypothetical protein
MFRMRRCLASSCPTHPLVLFSSVSNSRFDPSMRSLASFLPSYRSASFTVVVGPVLLRRTYLSNASRFEHQFVSQIPFAFSVFWRLGFPVLLHFPSAAAAAASSLRSADIDRKRDLVQRPFALRSFFFFFFVLGRFLRGLLTKRKGALLSLMFTDMNIDWIKF